MYLQILLADILWVTCIQEHISEWLYRYMFIYVFVIFYLNSWISLILINSEIVINTCSHFIFTITVFFPAQFKAFFKGIFTQLVKHKSTLVTAFRKFTSLWWYIKLLFYLYNLIYIFYQKHRKYSGF